MPAEPTQNRIAAFVVGTGHSGSTLLGLMLGAHSQIFYAGEARKSIFLDEPRKPMRKRACKLCGPSCPVWGTLRPKDHPGRDLYDLLSERTGRPVVLDSTKNAEWVDARAEEVRARGGRTHLFFLQRDGRAVVNSRLRKYPETSALEHVRDWKRQIEESERFAAGFDGPVHPIRYEALASDPAAELTSAAQFLELAFEPAMLAPWTTEQHPLGGNSGTQWLMAREQPKDGSMVELGARTRDYYESHPRAIVLDERWKKEMPAEAVQAFEAEASEANAPYAWTGR
jgi:hypothetical protein